MQTLMTEFQKFSVVSGLKANQLKSCIYFGGVREGVKEDILRWTGMSYGQLPFTYLGVPLSSQKLSVLQCRPLINKIMARIDCWSSKLLSYAGRVQLIRSVLFGIQTYWSQIFLIPQKVIKVLQSACRTFLWTGKSALSKRALVAWDKLCLPQNAGGLGILNMKIWNKAAICKMLWCLAQKKDKTWVRWIHGYYIKERDINTMEIPAQSSWIVKKIIGAREYLRDIQDGNTWLERGNMSIKMIYQALIGEIQRVPWGRMVSQNVAPPKCVFICWLLLHESLVTCNYLSRLGITVDPSCCFCDSAVEDLDHLFFGCHITGKIWQEVTSWCHLDRGQRIWRDEREFLMRQCTTKSKKQRLYRCALAVAVQQVWKERNMRRMQGKRKEIDVVIHQCKGIIAGRCQDRGMLSVISLR